VRQTEKPITIYEEFPILRRVKNTLNSVQNTENSTGRAQYEILKSPQPGKSKMRGPYMNTALNWSKLKNDSRLNAAQKKTIDKILVSLRLPVRDIHRNRPPINFDPKNIPIAQLNSRLRKAVAIKAAGPVNTSQRQTMAKKPNTVSTTPLLPTFPYGLQ